MLDTRNDDNGVGAHREHFMRHVVEHAWYRWTLPKDVRSVKLVETVLESWCERRRSIRICYLFSIYLGFMHKLKHHFHHYFLT